MTQYKGQTLWERLWRGPVPEEHKFFNPIKAKIGASFSIDHFGVRDVMFTLREIIEYKRMVNGKTLTFGDYVLLSRPIDGDDVWVRLRFMPTEISDSELTHNVLMLEKYDEMTWCEGLDTACREDTGELIITDHDNNTEEKYWRLNNLKDSFHAEIAIIKDRDGNGVVEYDEIERGCIEYWDYSRDTLDEANQQYTQYLFVELDKNTKVQTIWRGVEVDANRITVL